MQCRDFREVADSYLSNELLVETNHDMIVHLEACAECRRELAARRELRATLRASFAGEENLRIRQQFADGLSTELRIKAMTKVTSLISRRLAWMAIAACLLVASAVGLVAMWQRQRAKAPAQDGAAKEKPVDVQPPVAATSLDTEMVLAKMAEVAAGDHRDCAINHRLPDRPIDLDEAGHKYDKAYVSLAKAVSLHLGMSKEEIKLVAAHACVFQGRWFAHLVLRHRGHLASLLVTRLDDSAGLTENEKPTQFDQHAQVIACSTAAGYQISCFRTAHHAVFMVSDLSEGENLALAREMATSVYEHITRAEQIA
jgi:hypothetical protein